MHNVASADWMTRNLDRRVEHLVVVANFVAHQATRQHFTHLPQ